MTAPQRAVFYLLLAVLATVTALILLDARPAACGQPAPDTWELGRVLPTHPVPRGGPLMPDRSHSEPGAPASPLGTPQAGEREALYSLTEAQSVIDRWESTGGPTGTEVALARTIVVLWAWNEWAGQRVELDALWEEWLRFSPGIHPDYAPPQSGRSETP